MSLLLGGWLDDLSFGALSPAASEFSPGNGQDKFAFDGLCYLVAAMPDRDLAEGLKVWSLAGDGRPDERLAAFHKSQLPQA